jgi:hypothetical protein
LQRANVLCAGGGGQWQRQGGQHGARDGGAAAAVWGVKLEFHVQVFSFKRGGG